MAKSALAIGGPLGNHYSEIKLRPLVFRANIASLCSTHIAPEPLNTIISPIPIHDVII